MASLSEKVALRHLRRAFDPIESLKEHLDPSGPVEKGRDIVENLPGKAARWLVHHDDAGWLEEIVEEGGIDPSVEGKELVRQIRSLLLFPVPDWIPDQMFRDFWDWAEGRESLLEHPESPSWMHMIYRRDVPPDEWLVHLTDDARKLCSEGFKKGVSDPSKLGFTTRIHPDERRREGYNFAFSVDSKSFRGDVGRGRYGDEAVLFQPGPSGGVEVHHFGDRENQVIFWGPSATNMVCLRKTDVGWQPLVGGQVDEFDLQTIDHQFATIEHASRWAEMVT